MKLENYHYCREEGEYEGGLGSKDTDNAVSKDADNAVEYTLFIQLV